MEITVCFFVIFIGIAEQCCMPKMYEGFELKYSIRTNVTGKPSLIATTRNIAYDAVNEIIGIKGAVTTTTDSDLLTGLQTDDTTYINVIQFFRNKTQYSISNGTCTKTPFSSPFYEDCLPANATKVEQCTLGTETYKAVQSGFELTWTIDNNCFIIKRKSEGFYSGYKIKEITQLKDYRTGIRDRSVLRLPKICETTHNTAPLVLPDLSHLVFGRRGNVE